MRMIEVSEDALESIKRMAQEVQKERDDLLDAVLAVATSDDTVSSRKAMDDCILLALQLEKTR